MRAVPTGLRSGVAALGVAATLAAAAPAAPVRAAFGTRSLAMPPPAGFVGLRPQAPQMVDAMANYLPTTNRLVEVYVSPEDAGALTAGRVQDLDHYLQLQTLRAVDGTPVSATDFTGFVDSAEVEMKKAFGDFGKQAEELARQGNESNRAATGIDPKLSIGKPIYLGSPRREPWAFFFTIRAPVSVGDERTITRFAAGSTALIDHQIVYFYAYANDDKPDARAWAEQAVSAWADAVHAANPDDDALERSAQRMGGSIWSGALRTGLIGAVIGALVGLVGYVVRRRN